MNINLSNTLRQLRREKEVNQEALASAMNVSIQAVSKWETGASYPDIELLPDIAQYFGVTIDYLLTGKNQKAEAIAAAEPEEAPIPASTEGLQVAVAWYKDGEMLSKQFPQQPIRLEALRLFDAEDERGRELALQVNIYGNAQIDGRINGDANVKGDLQCERINGNVENAAAIEVGKVNGNVQAELIKCNKVNGDVKANVVHGPIEVGGNTNIGSYKELEN